MVGRDASTDGSVMSTHAADCGVCDFTWRHVPAAEHKPGEMRRLYNIDQIRTWPPAEGGKWAMVLKDPTAVEIPQAGPHLRLSPFRLRLHERPAAGHRRVDHRQRPQARQPHPDPGHEHHAADPPGHGALPDRPRGHQAHGIAGRGVRLRLPRRRRDAGRLRSEGDLGLRDHARRPALDAQERQARRGLGRAARARRPRLGLPQRIAHRRDGPRQPRPLHGLGPRRVLRRRGRACTIPRAASRSA